MLDVGDEVAAALRTSGQKGRVWGLAEYEGRSEVLQLDQSGSVRFAGSGVGAQAVTTIQVIGNAGSLVPRWASDLLAPYGQEVSLFRDVTVSANTYTVPLGVYRITGSRDSTVTQRTDAGGVGRPVSWRLEVNLADRLRVVERAKIIGRESYPLSESAWSELRRLVPLPVVVSLPDATVPLSLTYEDRPAAVKLLCDLLGGFPAVTREGAFTVRLKDGWAQTDLTPVFDIDGTISWSEEQADDFYNYVWAHSDDGEFSAFAALTDDSNPLSVNRAGQASYEHSSPLYTSLSAAEEGARTILKRLLGTRSRKVQVETGPEGVLLELGDVGWVRDPLQDRAVLGEVSSLDVPLNPTAPVRVELTVAEVS